MAVLAGKIAIITGGAGGIGQAIAARFAEEGATVCIADVTADAAQAAAATIGGSAFGMALDVTQADSIEAMVAAVLARHGRIDVLVNAAGLYGLQPWLEITEADFERIFAVNVKGLLFVSQAVAKQMVAQGGGVILNIASASGRHGNPQSVVYSASKMAVISLTQSAALGLAAHGVRVNAIAPGGVITPMWGTVRQLYAEQGGKAGADIDEALSRSIPLGRLSVPGDHVAAAVFLASDASGYITGQTLNIDGGLVLN